MGLYQPRLLDSHGYEKGDFPMKKQLTSLVETLLTKGMAVMESEQAQKILASPQAQKALDLGMTALTKAHEASECMKAGIVDKLGLATRKEVEDLRAQIEQLEAAKNVACTHDENQAGEQKDEKADA